MSVTMTYKCNILLGKIIKVNVHNATITLKTLINNVPELKSVFIEINGRPVPFFIAESDFHSADLLNMKLVDYDTADKINEFKGCRVFLTSDDALNPHSDNYEDLTGFSVFDENENKVGIINSVIENPKQWLFSILSVNKKEILLPVHEDLILSIDNVKKFIIEKIPEGLLDIN